MKIGVLCSGSLGFEILKKLYNSYTIEFVLTDKKSINISNFSKSKGIACFSGNPRKGKGYSFIKHIEIDILISVNYLFLIEADIFNHAKKLSFNIHGSLLPKNRGRTPHVWAIINGETKTGITAHVIDEGCDTGNIISQIEVIIDKDDTGATILDKYKNLYYPLIEEVISSCKNNSLNFVVQNENDATYNGKRTPEDGQINWNWSSEKILNWIRAQAYPYPGAFTYCKKKKLIIDKVELIIDKTFDNDKPGTIVNVKNNILVKTQDGVLRLNEIRTKNCTFELGQILYYEDSK